MLLEQRSNNPLSLPRWWILLLTLPVKVLLVQTTVVRVRWPEIRLLPENARGFSVTRLRFDLLVDAPFLYSCYLLAQYRFYSTTRWVVCVASTEDLTSRCFFFVHSSSGASGSQYIYLEITVSSPEKEVSKDLNPPSHSASSELPSSYPSLSLPAQPVIDDAESVRMSHRSKKPTQFFGDPLRHSIKLEEEDQILPSATTLTSLPIPAMEEQIMPSVAPTVSTSSPRKQTYSRSFSASTFNSVVVFSRSQEGNHWHRLTISPGEHY